MATTIQLTEIPENENVANRIFTLTGKGGDFGSAFDCYIQLPDRSGQVAAKHGCFVTSNGKVIVQAYSGANITIQGMAVAPGKNTVIEDGTIIGVGDYIMLVSIIANLEDETDNMDVSSENEHSFQAYFSPTAIAEDDIDDVIAMSVDQTRNSKQGQNMTQDKEPHFASSGVFSDDPFEDDPFKDEEISLVADNDDDTIVDELSNDNIETFFAEEAQDDDVDVILMKKSMVKSSDTETATANNDESKQQISQLVSLLESQIATNNEQQSKIFQVLDETLSTFINEFSPAHLEDVFDDFGTPFFVQKEKQYWRSFKKSFNRRLDKGEYHRLFKALLLENMQSNGDKKQGKKAGND